MKKTIFTVLFCILFSFTGFSQTPDEKIGMLINQPDVKTYASPQRLSMIEMMLRKSQILKDCPPSTIGRPDSDCVVPTKTLVWVLPQIQEKRWTGL